MADIDGGGCFFSAPQGHTPNFTIRIHQVYAVTWFLQFFGAYFFTLLFCHAVNFKKALGHSNRWNVELNSQRCRVSQHSLMLDPLTVDQDHLRNELRGHFLKSPDQTDVTRDLLLGEETWNIRYFNINFFVVFIQNPQLGVGAHDESSNCLFWISFGITDVDGPDKFQRALDVVGVESSFELVMLYEPVPHLLLLLPPLFQDGRLHEVISPVALLIQAELGIITEASSELIQFNVRICQHLSPTHLTRMVPNFWLMSWRLFHRLLLKR